MRPMGNKLTEGRAVRPVSLVAATLVAISMTMSAGAADPTLHLPIDCAGGRTCFVQNYVDNDASEGVKDYRCGARTYNGHNGTDIRLSSMKAQRRGVRVLAAADGKVLRMRDGMADVSIRISGTEAVAGRQCGNGLVIDHGDGWTTQYCHMANGSLSVKAGDRVVTGQPLGMVGLSGETEFPHLHITVRHGNDIVDPFAAGRTPDSCGGGVSLWDKATQDALAYRAGEVINVGFSAAPVNLQAIEAGNVEDSRPTPNSPALVAYARAIGLERGDEQSLKIWGPDGSLFSEYVAPPLDHDKAQIFVMAGRKRHAEPWPSGEYRATYTVTRGGVTVIATTFNIQL